MNTVDEDPCGDRVRDQRTECENHDPSNDASREMIHQCLS